MADTLIKVDLNQSAYDNENVHNRWHPDIPMACWVNPGDDFVLETYDWTGGFIKNDDSADDVRDIDLSIVHFLSGPVGVRGAEPGDLLVVDLLDIGARPDNQWGFNGFFSKTNGGGFLTEHFPSAQKSIWDFHGLYTSSRHIPGVNFAGLIHPGLIGCLPDPKMLETWNTREAALMATEPNRVPPLANPPFAATAHMGKLTGDAKAKAAATARAPCRRASMAVIATSRICRAARRSISRFTSKVLDCRWAIFTSAKATARSRSAARSRWQAGCTCASV
jgi:formamidase